MSIRRLALTVLATAAIGTLSASAQEPAPAPGAPPAAAPATATATAKGAPAQAPAAPAPSVATPAKTYYEAVSVEVNGKVENQGAITIEFTPLGGAPKLAVVNLLPKTKAKDVARDLGKELTIAAGAGYKVKVKGDRVLVSKANKKTENFAVAVANQTATGVAVMIRKD